MSLVGSLSSLTSASSRSRPAPEQAADPAHFIAVGGDVVRRTFDEYIQVGSVAFHHVTLPDGIAMDFADDQLVARSATPVSGNWVLNADQTFTVTWSMPSDLTAPAPDAFEVGFVTPPLNIVPLKATAGSDSLTLAVPADPAVSGNGYVSFFRTGWAT